MVEREYNFIWVEGWGGVGGEDIESRISRLSYGGKQGNANWDFLLFVVKQ